MQKLIAALIKAKSNFKDVKKEVQGYGYKYADLAVVNDCVDEALRGAELVLVQFPINDGDKVGVETTLYHSSGESISKAFVTDLTKRDPQAVGSVITYYRRYSKLAVLGLAPEDDDGEAAMPDLTPPKKTEVVNTAEYLIEFGKFKGQKLSEVGTDQLSNYVQFLMTQPKLNGKAKQFVDLALSHMENS